MKYEYNFKNVNGKLIYNPNANRLEIFVLDHYEFCPKTEEFIVHGTTSFGTAIDGGLNDLAERFFATEDDYRNGYTLRHVSTLHDMQIYRGGYGFDRRPDESRLVQKDENGLHPFDPNEVTYTIRIDGAGGLCVEPAAGGVYASREDYMLRNDYKVEQPDGSVRTVECAQSLLELNDKQKRAVAMFKDALGTLQSCGVGMLNMVDECGYYFFDRTRIDDWVADYEDESGYADYEDVTRLVAKATASHAHYFGADYHFYITRKSNK